jgi:hypothetical protein
MAPALWVRARQDKKERGRAEPHRSPWWKLADRVIYRGFRYASSRYAATSSGHTPPVPRQDGNAKGAAACFLAILTARMGQSKLYVAFDQFRGGWLPLLEKEVPEWQVALFDSRTSNT